MDDTIRTREDKLGLLLGSTAVRRGLITSAQLREALAEQAREAAANRHAPRPLGVILVARGYLAEQQLLALLQEQRERAASGGLENVKDSLLGQILVRHGPVTAVQVEECLRVQATLIEEGYKPAPRLGEILVQKGYASETQIARALSAQKKSILHCGACGRSYNVPNYDRDRVYRCTHCQGALEPLPACDNIRVDGSVILPAAMLPAVSRTPEPPTPDGETLRIPRGTR